MRYSPVRGDRVHEAPAVGQDRAPAEQVDKVHPVGVEALPHHQVEFVRQGNQGGEEAIDDDHIGHGDVQDQVTQEMVVKDADPIEGSTRPKTTIKPILSTVLMIVI